MRTTSGRLLLLALFALATVLLSAPLVLAQDSAIGLSGSFYRQEYEAAQGSRLGGPSIYVTVFNQGDGPVDVNLVFEAPSGVSVIFSEESFALAPGDQKRVLVGLDVAPEALPGDYVVRVFAEVLASGGAGGGSQLVQGVGQEATLKIIGSSASVQLQAKSPTGEEIVAVLRLFRVGESGNVEVSSSETGALDARVVPGTYIAQAFVAGDKIAEESFEVMEGEERSLELTGSTIYFNAFDVLPTFRSNAQDIAEVEVFYGVTNLVGAVTDARIVLSVRRDGAPLDEISLLSLSQLGIGQTSGERSYSPDGGWESGEYAFRLELYSGDTLLITSLDEVIPVGEGGASTESTPERPTSGEPSSGGSSFPAIELVVGGVGAVLLILILISVGRRLWLRFTD